MSGASGDKELVLEMPFFPYYVVPACPIFAELLKLEQIKSYPESLDRPVEHEGKKGFINFCSHTCIFWYFGGMNQRQV